MTKNAMTIGNDLKGHAFKLPLDAVTATLIALGGKGMGKTNLGSVIVEELNAMGQRWAGLDPIGVSWGLRHSADGKGNGVPCLILGGVHGDIPIEPSGGAAVADIVIEENVNVLIDFSRYANGEMWGPTEKVRFCTAYIRQLFKRQGQMQGGRRRTPIFQWLDEAARYVPQVVPHGNPELAACVSAWEQAVEEGRNIGLGIGLWTLRSARLNKSVSELADALFAFRTVGPNSLDSIMDWLGQHADKAHVKALAEQVRSLDRGTCLVVSPGWLKREEIVRVRLRTTYDSSATPKAGEKQRRVQGQGAKPDLASIRDRMKEAVEKAKENDPKELKKLLAEAQAKVKKLEAAPPKAAAVKPVTKTVTKIKLVKTKAIEPGQIKQLKQILVAHYDKMRLLHKDAREQHEQACRDIDFLIKCVETADISYAKVLDAVAKLNEGNGSDFIPTGALQLPSDGKRYLIAVGAGGTGNQGNHGGSGDGAQYKGGRINPEEVVINNAEGQVLGKGERIILTAIAQNGDRATTMEELTVLTGYKETSRRTYLQRLGARALVRFEGAAVVATPEGIAALGDFERLPTGDDLRRYWANKLGGGEQSIFKLLNDAHGHAMTKAAIAEAVNYKETSMRTYLQRLGARKLITVGGDVVALSNHLFS